MAARPRTLPAAVALVIAASALAFYDGAFRWDAALVAMLGALFVQIGANFADNVYDYQKGADASLRLGPSRVTQGGLLTPTQVKVGMGVVFLLAALCGVYLTFISGWVVLLIGVLSILSAVLYTAGPYSLGYNVQWAGGSVRVSLLWAGGGGGHLIYAYPHCDDECPGDQPADADQTVCRDMGWCVQDHRRGRELERNRSSQYLCSGSGVQPGGSVHPLRRDMGRGCVQYKTTIELSLSAPPPAEVTPHKGEWSTFEPGGSLREGYGVGDESRGCCGDPLSFPAEHFAWALLFSTGMKRITRCATQIPDGS